MSDTTKQSLGHWVDKSGFAYVESADIAKRADELGLKYYPPGERLPHVIDVEPEKPTEPAEREPGIDLAPAGAPLTKAQKKAAAEAQAKLDAEEEAAKLANPATSFDSELNDLDIP
jgi:hypothetical protein